MARAIVGECRFTMETLHQILSVCDNSGAGRTAIMSQSSPSQGQLRRYLELLSGQDLIHRKEDGRFQMTPMGQKTFRQMSGVMKALRN